MRLVHVAFEALLDVLEMQRDHAGALGVPPKEAAGVGRFLEDTARDIMRIGEGHWWCTGAFWVAEIKCSHPNAACYRSPNHKFAACMPCRSLHDQLPDW